MFTGLIGFITFAILIFTVIAAIYVAAEAVNEYGADVLESIGRLWKDTIYSNKVVEIYLMTKSVSKY